MDDYIYNTLNQQQKNYLSYLIGGVDESKILLVCTCAHHHENYYFMNADNTTGKALNKDIVSYADVDCKGVNTWPTLPTNYFQYAYSLGCPFYLQLKLGLDNDHTSAISQHKQFHSFFPILWSTYNVLQAGGKYVIPLKKANIHSNLNNVLKKNDVDKYFSWKIIHGSHMDFIIGTEKKSYNEFNCNFLVFTKLYTFNNLQYTYSEWF